MEKMTKEELYECRKKLTESASKFHELNEKYNKCLSAKCEKESGEGSFDILESKAMDIAKRITPLISLMVGTVVAFFKLPIFILFIYIFSQPIVTTAIVVFANRKKIDFKSMSKKGKQEESVDMDFLYEEVNNARSSYHKLYNEYESMLNMMSDEEFEAYMEYLREVDAYIELLESESTNKDKMSTEHKLKELKNTTE